MNDTKTSQSPTGTTSTGPDSNPPAPGTGTTTTNSKPSEFWTVFLLSIFLGAFGVHRFYARKFKSGAIQLVTFGLCGMWSLVDIVTILLGKFKNSSGVVYRNPKPRASWGVFAAFCILGIIGGTGGFDEPYLGGYVGSNLPRGFDNAYVSIKSEELSAVMDVGPAHVTHLGQITKTTKIDDDTYEIEATAKVSSNVSGLKTSDDIQTRCRWHKGATKDQDSIDYSNSKMSLHLTRAK